MVFPNSLPPNLTYSVCGLRVRSDRCIPDLIPSNFDSPDVEITLLDDCELPYFGARTIQYSSEELDPEGKPVVRLWEITEPSSFYLLAYADGTRFLIDLSGSKVWAKWAAPATFEDMLTYLLGPVLGFVLRLRGVVCLHASAIAVGNAAIALCGRGGAGKSTIAAQFSAMGYPVLSDDIVTLEENGSSFLVHPSSARLRLWPSSVKALFGRYDALPRLTPSWEKQYLDLRSAECILQSSPLPLTAIYLLGNVDQAAGKVVDLSPASAMVHLLGNVYGNYLLDTRFRRRDFDQIAKVMRTVPVRQLNLQHDFSVLEQTCCSILRDLDKLERNSRPLSPAIDTCGLASCVR